LKAAAEETIDPPATGNIKALLIENFSVEAPELPEEQRIEWKGKYYASGIGLVIEADAWEGPASLRSIN
jgi:hypothetical protein